MKRDINQVRQVLMNELGLSRETVKTMMTEIIEDVVNKHINQIISDDVDEFVMRAIDRKLFEKYPSQNDIRMMTHKAIEEKLNASFEVVLKG